MTSALTATEFKLRYFGSVLGYLWTVLRPLMLFGVLYVVFTHVVRFGGKVPHYPVVLLAAIVVFNFFSEATSGGLGSLVARENLLRKVVLSPRRGADLRVADGRRQPGARLLVVFVLRADRRRRAGPGLARLPGLACVFVVVLATAGSVLLSVLYVRYRDVQPIWEVALQLLFWGTPIIYTIESVPENFQQVIDAEPARRWRSSRAATGSCPIDRERSRGDRRHGPLLAPLAIFVAVGGAERVEVPAREGRLAEEL